MNDHVLNKKAKYLTLTLSVRNSIAINAPAMAAQQSITTDLRFYRPSLRANKRSAPVLFVRLTWLLWDCYTALSYRCKNRGYIIRGKQ